jgi:hypothetical protein
VARSLPFVVSSDKRSLQLNIGIIAACASFLKPLVGRVLKINSSAGYYPSSQQYNRSGRTPMGASVMASGARRGNGQKVEDFELRGMDAGSVRSAGDQVYVASDGNSEEIILDKALGGRVHME